MIIIHDKPNWTRAPSLVHNEVMIVGSVILVLRIEYNKRTAKQLESTHVRWPSTDGSQHQELPNYTLEEQDEPAPSVFDHALC